MKLNLKKINYHKWIPSRFSSFQAKLLIAFLVATLLPLTLVALVSYHVSYNLARDRITNSALMSDEQLIFQLNSRLNQTENVADTIQYQMYAFEHSSPDQVGTMQALTSMRSNISLYKSTFATVYKGNIIKNLIMDCQSYTKYRPNETTGGIFVSWRRKEELPTGA